MEPFEVSSSIDDHSQRMDYTAYHVMDDSLLQDKEGMHQNHLSTISIPNNNNNDNDDNKYNTTSLGDDIRVI